MSEHLPSFDLDGRVVVVTGASRGIGRGLAEAIAAAGATVAVTARRVEDARRVVDAIDEAGGAASAHALDVTDVAGLRREIDAIADRHGRIDVAVLNAGLGFNLPALDVDEAHWDAMMDVNLKGAFFTAQACARHMVERGEGRIVAISSQASTVGIVDHVAYSSSKGGLNQMVRVLALEWGPLGITVNAVAPTFITRREPPNDSMTPSIGRGWSIGSQPAMSARRAMSPAPSSTLRRRPARSSTAPCSPSTAAGPRSSSRSFLNSCSSLVPDKRTFSRAGSRLTFHFLSSGVASHFPLSARCPAVAFGAIPGATWGK